jgi:small subunit ribosomal protein S18
MARSNDRDRGTKRAPKDDRRRGGKKKVCIFCKDKTEWIDYKDVNVLRRFMSDRGKIRARRVTGNCSQHQRDVAVAIKTSRELALLPYLQRTVAERSGGRGGRDRGDRGPRPERRDAPEAAVEGVDGVEALPDDVTLDGDAVVPEAIGDALVADLVDADTAEAE